MTKTWYNNSVYICGSINQRVTTYYSHTVLYIPQFQRSNFFVITASMFHFLFRLLPTKDLTETSLKVSIQNDQHLHQMSHIPASKTERFEVYYRTWSVYCVVIVGPYWLHQVDDSDTDIWLMLALIAVHIKYPYGIRWMEGWHIHVW